MKSLLLFVEDFSNAKHRMSGVLSRKERAGLARSMYLDVVTAILGARSLDRVVVLTPSVEVGEMTPSSEFDILIEDTTLNHTYEANRVMAQLTSIGTVIAISADLPVLKSIEIDVALNECEMDLGLIPSMDGARVNGTIMHPNMRTEMAFGPGSLQRGLSACRSAGIPFKILNVGGIAFNVDSADDLISFLQSEPEPTHTWQYIQTHRIPLSLLP